MYWPTFLFSFTENGVAISDGHQSNVVVVYDVLWVLEAIVSAQEVVKCYRLHRAELVEEKDVQNLCRLVIVVWQASFMEFVSRATELPADMLHSNE